MSDDEYGGAAGALDDPSGQKRRRRRRRRKKGGRESGAEWGDDVLLSDDSGPTVTVESAPRGKGRRQSFDVSGPQVSLPSSGRNPFRKRSSRAKRAAPSNAGSRRRRVSRAAVEELTKWLDEVPEPLLNALHRGLGGQVSRTAGKTRTAQLAVRAITQQGKLGAAVKQLHERDRKSLAALVQAGGVAHAEELHRELAMSYGGHAGEWRKALLGLANRGLVFASAEQDGEFFYVLPDPLVDLLIAELQEELSLPMFMHDDVRVMDVRPFCPGLDFSVTTLATYIDQTAPRLSQRHEIYRVDQEAMDRFFAQIWEPDSELFGFHLDFLMMHGMIELRGEYLQLNREVGEEWLQLESEDQRDLMFRALDKRFASAEWVLWAIHAATRAAIADGNGNQAWVAERPLIAMYRRWKRGEDWRDRLGRGAFSASRTAERESFSFAPLVRAGVLDMGQWGQEKFYRLSQRGIHLLEPAEDDGFRQFYLTPSFEIMAPAGLAPSILYRIGELADLIGCDRANTYRITEQSIERALSRGWRREDILQFLRDNSQIGLPDNVEQTLKGWIGHRGDVEFHDLMLITVHRSQIKRIEGSKRAKPYLLHRFAPGMYAIDRSKKDEVSAMLRDIGFSPAQDVRGYPGAPEQVGARQALHRLVGEARDAVIDPTQRGQHLIAPNALRAVPGTRTADKVEAAVDEPPVVSQDEVRMILERAMSKDLDVEMVYQNKTGQRQTLIVQPQRIAFKAEDLVLVGLDRDDGERRSFMVGRIERLRLRPEA